MRESTSMINYIIDITEMILINGSRWLGWRQFPALLQAERAAQEMNGGASCDGLMSDVTVQAVLHAPARSIPGQRARGAPLAR